MNDNATSPCINCESRYRACQDSCVRKAAWDLTWDGIKDKQRKKDIYDEYKAKKFEDEHRKMDKKRHERKKGY